MPKNLPQAVNAQDPKTWPTVNKSTTMWGTTGRMRKVLEKYPALGDEWVKKQLEGMHLPLLYSDGIADAIRKGLVGTEKSYVELPGFLEYNKDNSKALNQAAKKYGGDVIEQMSKLTPEAQELEKRSIKAASDPIVEMMTQAGAAPFGQSEMRDLLDMLHSPQTMDEMRRIMQEGPRVFESYRGKTPEEELSALYGGIKGGAESLYGGARSGLESIYNMGRSGIEGLQGLYNNWRQPAPSPSGMQGLNDLYNNQSPQNPMQNISPQQEMELKLAMLNNQPQHDPLTGLGGRIKQGRR